MLVFSDSKQLVNGEKGKTKAANSRATCLKCFIFCFR